MNPQDRLHLPQDEDRLLEYLDGQLPAPEARAIEAHLAVCPECQALRRQWEQLDGKLTRTLAQLKLSPDFSARLRRQVVVESKAGAQGVGVQEGEGPGTQKGQVWIETRSRGSNVLWLDLVDVVGYGAAAAIGGYGLFHLAAAWVPGPAGGGSAFLRSPAFLFALVAAGAVLLAGLNLAARNRLLRWLGAL